MHCPHFSQLAKFRMCRSPTGLDSWSLTNDNARRRRLEEEEDRLSMLPDDVLLSILGRVHLTAATRTSALSTRWRHLPWLLPELSIDVDDFIYVADSEPIDDNALHNAMITVTAVTKSLFAKPQRNSIVTRLQLKLYSINTFSCDDIGSLVCDAIDRGLLNDLDLTFFNDKIPWESPESDLLKRAQDIDGFFRSYPSVLRCLTRLSLCGLNFVEVDMHHVLFDCCTHLEHLDLFGCHVGPNGWWKIDAPNSKLRVLELDKCLFERIELISHPKLEKVTRVGWRSNYAPLSFGFVPSLEELELAHFLYLDQYLFKLSEILHGATGIHTLTLDFIGNTIWLQPEIKQLVSGFRKLRKLFIKAVFVEFDLLWTTAFLEAAPSVEILRIEVYEPCEREDMHYQFSPRYRTSPQWDLDFRGSKNLAQRAPYHLLQAARAAGDVYQSDPGAGSKSADGGSE